MALTDIPTVRPTDTQVYLMAISVITFIFFFTQRKSSDSTTSTTQVS
ncbi:hypothetical protein ACFCYN_08960 [Gottfriedia sp. NPDC056225]|nr:hypothetical protein HPK19_11105 [Arthrobacter citreus]